MKLHSSCEIYFALVALDTHLESQTYFSEGIMFEISDEHLKWCDRNY